MQNSALMTDDSVAEDDGAGLLARDTRRAERRRRNRFAKRRNRAKLGIVYGEVTDADPNQFCRRVAKAIRSKLVGSGASRSPRKWWLRAQADRSIGEMRRWLDEFSASSETLKASPPTLEVCGAVCSHGTVTAYCKEVVGNGAVFTAVPIAD